MHRIVIAVAAATLMWFGIAANVSAQPVVYEEAKLIASDAAAGDWFGESVAMLGDTVIVGALYDDCSAGADCGAAYVFERPAAGWTAGQPTSSKSRLADGREH